MSVMKGIQISKHGDVQALQYLTNLPKPKPEGTQVLVRNAFIGVNFIDTYHRSGLYSVPLPAILGRESSGVIEELGSMVPKGTWNVGDRVVCITPSTYADYTVINEDRMVKIPDSIPLDQAAAAYLQGMTAIGLTTDAYQVKPGDTVLVHAAAGGVGSLLCQVASALGATVIGTTSTEEKAALAKQNGAHHVVIYTKENVIDRVLALTDGQGCHCVYDGVGKDTFSQSLALTRKRGSLISYGNASGKVDPVDILSLAKNCVRLSRFTLFEIISSSQELKDLSTQLFNMIQADKIHFDIYKIYPLSEAAQAHSDLEGRKTTGKLLLKP